jgi:hypothetical protein
MSFSGSVAAAAVDDVVVREVSGAVVPFRGAEEDGYEYSFGLRS